MDIITDGLKHDGGKPRLSLVPAKAIIAIGTVMTHGAQKYGEKSYKQVSPVRYRDALMRHEYCRCPSCLVILSYEMRYCDNCGQKLDWGAMR